MRKWVRIHSVSVTLLAAMIAGCGGGSAQTGGVNATTDPGSGAPSAVSSGQGQGNPEGAIEPAPSGGNQGPQ